VTPNSLRCVFSWIIAAVLLFRAGTAIYESFETSNWPGVDAIVVESDARWVENRQSVRRSMWSYQLPYVIPTLLKEEVTSGHAPGLAPGGLLRISILLIPQLRANSPPAFGCKHITTHSILHALYLRRPHACPCA
jgi:hypothetical protein